MSALVVYPFYNYSFDDCWLYVVMQYQFIGPRKYQSSFQKVLKAEKKIARMMKVMGQKYWVIVVHIVTL